MIYIISQLNQVFKIQFKLTKNIDCHNACIDDIQNRFLTGKYSVIHLQQGIYQHITTKGARNPFGFMGSKSEAHFHLNSAGCRMQGANMLVNRFIFILFYSSFYHNIPWNELYHRSRELYFHIIMTRYQFLSAFMRFSNFITIYEVCIVWGPFKWNLRGIWINIFQNFIPYNRTPKADTC